VIELKNFIAAPAAFPLQSLPTPVLRRWSLTNSSPHPAPVRVALVSSDAQLGETVSQQLAQDPRTQLAFRARTLREGLRLRAHDTIDVLLVDLDLEDGDGLDLVLPLKEGRPAAEAIVMARHDDEEAALRAFDLGAAGWLVLHNWFGSFAMSVLNVASGGSALAPALARRLMRRPAPARIAPPPPRSAFCAITEREREVLAHVAHGLRSKEIARALAISDETVNTHVKSIYRKLQVHSRAQLVRIASQAGIV
jgi:DNA-binding NarL/FixJ family response regulator